MSLSYDEMLGLTEEKLEKMGVTKVIKKPKFIQNKSLKIY